MTAPMQPMSARRQLRLAVLGALNAMKTSAGIATIDSPGDWTTPPEKLPAVLMRSGRGHRESKMKGMVEFDSSVAIEIEARVEAASASAAQDAIEALSYAIENAILTDYNVIGMVQQVSSIDEEIEITAEGKHHLGGIKMVLSFELFEAFDPTATAPAATTWPAVPAQIVPLTNFTLTGDLINIFDPNGTYVGTLFPSEVLPAPRTSGPDGRMEGGLDITLPQ